MNTLAKTPALKLYRWTECMAALFILLFVYTASSKLMDLQRFRAVLDTSPLIGPYSKMVALLIPLTELITAALLVFPGTRKRGLVLSLILMVLFTLYLFYMILFTSHLPCSCGGVIQALSWSQHLALNITLTAMAAWAVFLHKIFVATNRGNRKPAEESRYHL